MRLTATFLILVGCSTAVAEKPGTAEKPNIVLILADDVGVDAIGCYGGQSYKTPRIDALAKGGIRYSHCFSMPSCHPTRVCLLTGMYPFRLGHPRWGTFPRRIEPKTFAHVMRRAGYRTAIAGKWQLSLLGKDRRHPNRLGFDAFCLFGWHEGPRYHRPMIWQNGELRSDVRRKYGPIVYTDFLIDFIKQDSRKPFLAFYSMALCHDVTDDLDKPVPFGPRKRYDTFREMMVQMDRQVGRLVDAITRLGLRKKTLILFTGDNGTPKRSIITASKNRYTRVPVFSVRSGQVVQGGKGNLSDDGTNVPLIANWPGKVSSGKVRDDLVDMSDFLPTFAELAGAPQASPLSRLDGQSFAGSLTGGPAKRTWAFAEARGRYWVRTQRWKLYNNGKFFDVLKDPRERRTIQQPTGEAGQALATLEMAAKKLGWRKKKK